MNNNYIEVPILVLADITEYIDYESMGLPSMELPSMEPETEVEMATINTSHIVAFWPDTDDQTVVSTVSDRFLVVMPYQEFKSKVHN